MTNLQTLKLRAASHGPADTREPSPSSPEPVASHRHPSDGSRRKRLLALLVVTVVTTFAAIAAGDSVHDSVVGYLAGAVGLTLALLVVVEAGAAAQRGRRRSKPAATPAAAAPPRQRGFSKTKAALVLAMCAGIAAYFGGAGTFAGFTAETTNAGSNIAAGTLTLNNSVNGAAACASTSASSNDNVNPGCNLMFSQLNTGANSGFNNWEPTNVGVAKITLENTGSLNASKLYLSAPYVQGTLGTQINGGTTPSSISLSSALTSPVASGDSIQVDYGPYQNTWCATAPAAIGATSITVGTSSGACTAVPASGQALGTFQVNARVQDVSSDAIATGSTANTDCYDKLTTVAGGNPSVSGATYGSLGFNSTSGNPLCNTLLIWVQEQTSSGYNYCWYGNSTGAPTGGCAAPISVVLAGSVTIGSSTTSLTVPSLNGNVAVGDVLNITQGATVSQCTVATSPAYINATSITVNSCANVSPAGSSNSFTAGAIVTDTTTQTTLNTDSTHSIANFDTTTKGASHIELQPVTANGTKTPSGVDLAQYSSGHVTDARTFYVGVYFPSGSNPQNTLQALYSTFGVSWHIDQ